MQEFLESISETKIESLFADLNTIEKEIKKLTDKKSKIKKEIGDRLSNGF